MTTAPVPAVLVSAMQVALVEARAAAEAGEVPVGAVIVDNTTGAILAMAQNRMRRDGDGTSHAELLALRMAAKQRGDRDLTDCSLVVTLEPCAMCAGAIVLSRIDSLVFGAWDDKAGMCGSVGDIVRHPRLNHRPQVRGGVLAEECAALLRDFFALRR
ncbi:tRNA adenosine(34) deaminase TadA [Gemmatimonas sp.]|jgi:tRNA(adenine34) deaminase|uniref:tRNA adenosine(34) deaminase TadA n=1 Tax=Gemmatimonas sp. TaxID=1962908 RepID=UPI0037BEF1E6